MPVLQDPDRRFGAVEPDSDYNTAAKEDDGEAGTGAPTLSSSRTSFFSPDLEDSGIKSIKSREELIHSIKKGENPSWVSHAVSEFAGSFRTHDSDMTQAYSHAQKVSISATGDLSTVEYPQSGLSSPHDIQRPRSALHSGDFRQNSPERSLGYQTPRIQDNEGPQYFSSLGSSPTTPWYVPAATQSFRRIEHEPSYEDSISQRSLSRSRAPSLGSSYSSSFVYRPPTSPLVHSASNTDLEMSLQSTTDKASRRRTLPPETFSQSNASPQGARSASYGRPLSNLRREHSLPYQAHQPRRPLASFPFSEGPSTPTRSRAPSLSSEVSPLQHASMVGSYEESILRGRMSTTPSKPLDFLAQIGVLGKGDCKPSLRCPAHVTVPFPAVFYSYSSGSGRNYGTDDSPSPYVGNIDLEHNLKPVTTKSKRKHDGSKQVSEDVEPTSKDITAPENTSIGIQLDRRKREKRRRRSRSPQAPIGGCYRIPQKGQLQIIIKNPNKTAVKLFLVPYDLDGMEQGTKTFIRQRSYSQGAILDIPGTKDTAGFEKPTLRYLIHLRICCPSKGRFYLYDNIRVVFANRVPDGKEKLRNEIQLPEPRYSTWKANKDSTVVGNAGARLAAEKASRRRSAGFGPPPFGFGDIDGLGSGGIERNSFGRPSINAPSLPTVPYDYSTSHLQPGFRSSTVAREPEPSTTTSFIPSRPSSKDSNITSSAASTQMQVVSGFNIGSRSTSPAVSNYNDAASESGETSSTSSGAYNRLRRQEGRYGSNERFQGLLAQRLKGLGVGQTDVTAGNSSDNGSENGKTDGDVEMS